MQGHVDLGRNQLYTEIALLLGLPRYEITPEASLRSDLGVDSLDTVELVEALEQSFHVQISDDDLSMVETVDDLERCMTAAG